MSNSLSSSLKLFFLVLLFSSTLANTAQETDEESNTVYAESLNEVEIVFPPQLRIYGREAWVQLAYIVNKNGTATDFMVESSVGGPEFEKAAIEAIKQVKFSPAKYKGDVVEQSITGVHIPFVLEQTFEGADTSFAENFASMTALFNSDKTEEAVVILEKLKESQDLTLLEVSMLELANAMHASKNGDGLAQLQHLRNASVNEGQYLPKEMLTNVLQKRFALAAKLSYFDEAVKSYELLEKTDPLNDKLTAIAMMIAPIQNAIADGRNIIVRGKINDRGYWHYKPLRRVFSFASADENVKEFEPRCEHSNKRFQVNTTSEWKIPDSWGDCSIVIYGEPGSTFALFEFDEIGKE